MDFVDSSSASRRIEAWNEEWLAGSMPQPLTHSQMQTPTSFATRDDDESGCDMLGTMGLTSAGSSKDKATSRPVDFIYKDKDAIKLFVGQIPKHIYEDQLEPVFARFGEIFDLAVIRDKTSGNHRGCAFLTYCSRTSAYAAIAALHGKERLERGQNMLQVRPADGHQNKLFVGMMPRTITERDIRAVFGAYGDVHEVYIIHNQHAAVKGCAFVNYVDNDSCLNAIDALNGSHIFNGPCPLVVKFAESKRKSRALIAQSASSSPGAPCTRPLDDEGRWRRYFAAAQVGDCAHCVPAVFPCTISQQSFVSMQMAKIPSLGNHRYSPSSPTGFQFTTLGADGYYLGAPSSAGEDIHCGVEGSMNYRQELEQDNRSHSTVAASKTEEGPPGFVSYTESPQAEVPNAQMNEFLIDSKQLKVQHEGREQFTGNIPYPSGDCSGRPSFKTRVMETADYLEQSWSPSTIAGIIAVILAFGHIGGRYFHQPR